MHTIRREKGREKQRNSEREREEREVKRRRVRETPIFAGVFASTATLLLMTAMLSAQNKEGRRFHPRFRLESCATIFVQRSATQRSARAPTFFTLRRGCCAHNLEGRERERGREGGEKERENEIERKRDRESTVIRRSVRVVL